MFVENYFNLAKTVIFSIYIRISDVLELFINDGQGEYFWVKRNFSSLMERQCSVVILDA